MTIHLILGGARSGKSSFAETIAKQHETELQSAVCYLATAQSLDSEMSARITKHQEQRPAHWALVESPLTLADAIKGIVSKHKLTHKVLQDKMSHKPVTILVDCLTLWLTNCLCAPSENIWQQEKQALLALLATLEKHADVHLLLVSNEVGHGIVPMGELSREFVDQAGWLHQDIAALATRVDFIMAGIALPLKPQEHK